ncbi:MAG: glycosyltransferase, partial [Actinomycetota bacterium]
MSIVVLATTIAFMAFSVALTVIYLVLTGLAGREVTDYVRARRGLPTEDLFSSPLTPPVSVLVPAYNESAGVVESVTALLGLRYPEFEVVVVNDGSTDDTLERLVAAFGLEPIDPAHPRPLDTRPVRGVYHSPEFPGLMVIDKENGGKSDALNAGINAARYPLVCSIDGDSVLEPDALLKVVEPMVARPDRVVATGGIVRVANGSTFSRGSLVEARLPRNLLPRLQIVEYLRSFLVGRTGWSRINALLIVSGAFGVFRRDAVIRVGGYAHTIGEDAELVVRLHRRMVEEGRPYAVTFVSDPVCWTEAPESLKVLRRQRIRWQRGLLETLWTHRKMILNPRYGNLGMLAMPYFLFFELLGPLVEAAGLPLLALFAATGYLDVMVSVELALVSVGVGLLLSFTALLFEELSFHRYPRFGTLLALTAVSFLENFGYRQLVAFWRVQALVQAARGPAKWGRMTRTGAAAGSGGIRLQARGGRLDALRTAVDEALAAQAQLAAASEPEP